MLRIGDCFEAKVRDLSSEGNGVVEHASGHIFFVPGVWIGETARFRITGFKNRFGFASLEELILPSPERLSPRCPHHGFTDTNCGGCAWQFISYPAQLAAKEQRLRKQLARFGIENRIRPIRESRQIFGYRNRAQLKTDGRRLGYVGANSRTLVPVSDCPILSATNRQTLAQLLLKLPVREWQVIGKKEWNSIDIDEDTSADAVVMNQRRPFRQANDAQNAAMKNWLLEKLTGLPDSEKESGVIELFCGSGNFTESIVEAGITDILAVEAVPEALQKLDEKALPGVETLLQNLYLDAALPAILRKRPNARVVVLDPPRHGLKNAEKLLLQKKRIRHIFYISCDLATFARDCQHFTQEGFEFMEVQPIDQFPQTPHLELLAHLAARI